MLDYYAILGVAPNASVAEIKAAWKQGLLYWHPDKNKNPEANAYTLQIMEAYSCLSDNEKRELYDKAYHAAQHKVRPTGSVLTDTIKETPKEWKIYQFIILILLQLLWLIFR